MPTTKPTGTGICTVCGQKVKACLNGSGQKHKLPPGWAGDAHLRNLLWDKVKK